MEEGGERGREVEERESEKDRERETLTSTEGPCAVHTLTTHPTLTPLPKGLLLEDMGLFLARLSTHRYTHIQKLST